MVFNPADYRNMLLIAEGDFLAELSLRRGTESDPQSPVRPIIIQDVAEAFLDAGADLLLTHTPDANTLIRAELETGDAPDAKSLHETNRQAAALLRSTLSDYPRPADRPIHLLGTVGPLERLLMLGEIDEDAIFQAYRDQAAALAAGGADAILCDAFAELDALCVVVRAAKEGAGLPVIGTVIVDAGPERTETPLGATVPQVCEALIEAGVDALGFNAGEEPANAPVAAALFRASCSLPLWAEVSPGLPQLIEGRVVYPETPAEFADRLKALREAGVNIFRGGQGASADHISAVAKARRP